MARILGVKTSHDGTLALIEDGVLRFSLEAEKDSNPRYRSLSGEQTLKVLSQLEDMPEVIAVGGWSGYLTGYSGLTRPSAKATRFLGRDVRMFSSSHERSHLLGAYAMSPYEQGRKCYALVWEGTIGSFYEIDEKVAIRKIGDVVSNPGWRYSYLYYLGGNEPAQGERWGNGNMAGKLMALAAWPRTTPLTPEERSLTDWILSDSHPRRPEAVWPDYLPANKAALPARPESIARGHTDAAFRNFAAHFSDALFDKFHQFAKQHLTRGLPLLISGGCGLNCEWNTRWLNTKLFADVFVPPCANDSGSAIGTAVDAQHALTGRAKLKWSVYAGEAFVRDCAIAAIWTEMPLDCARIAELLKKGAVIPWVQGRYEIGPRALGHRSLLAAPFERRTTTELNRIKGRESYRPIAPICLEEDVAEHFDWSGPSPYMLHFQRVKNDRLKAVTHDDQSARVQTLNRAQCAKTHELLHAFKATTGVGVLCNTSLNLKGRGFINRLSHLVRFAEEHELTCFVVDERMFVRKNAAL